MTNSLSVLIVIAKDLLIVGINQRHLHTPLRSAAVVFEFYVTAVFGILRWPVWTAIAYMPFAVLVYLSIVYGWELPDNLTTWNPIFANAFRQVALFSLAQCAIGYALGRSVRFLGRRLFQKGR